MSEHHIEYALVLSSSHVPDKFDGDRTHTLDKLGFKQGMPRVSPHAHGWVVFLSSQEDQSVPAWFTPILALALKGDVSFVIFDSAGQILDNLNTYEW